MEPPAPDPRRVAEAFAACAEPSWGLLKQVGPKISYSARSGRWTFLAQIDYGDPYHDATRLEAVLLDLVRSRRFDLLDPGFDWNGVITYDHGPEKDDCLSLYLGGPRRELAHVNGVIYRLWALLLSWGVPCPARFAALREDPMWGALRAEQGALWGGLAARADVSLSRQQRAERACQLLDENDGFRAA